MFHSRFTEALPSEPLGDLLGRRVVVERNGGLRRAMDDQRFVQIGLSVGQPLEQLVVHQHDWKNAEYRNKDRVYSTAIPPNQLHL